MYCADLGLPGEFRTTIAHLIREQLDAHARSLSSIRHIRGDQILHDELRPAFQSILVDPIRSNDVETWTPHLEKLNLIELDHREKERERQTRRQKRGARNNRRNVVTLPDREPLRTNRTLMPKPGAELEVPEVEGIDGMIVPSFEVASPFPLVPVQDLGPPPQMTSPLRKAPRIRQELPALSIVNPETGTPISRPKLPGRRRGRPPLDPIRRALWEQYYVTPATPDSPSIAGQSDINMDPVNETGSPDPSTVVTPSTAASPNRQTSVPAAIPPTVLPPAPPVKRPPGRPPKMKNGWIRSQGAAHPNIIDGKWHCTSEQHCVLRPLVRRVSTNTDLICACRARHRLRRPGAHCRWKTERSRWLKHAVC